jgi:hypothetical protein
MSKPQLGRVQGMVGGFSQRAAIICGGGSSYDDVTGLCFEFDASNNRCANYRATLPTPS